MKKIITIFLLLCSIATIAQNKLSTTSKRAEKFYREGIGLYDRNDYTNAITNFRRAAQIDHEFVEAWLLLAEIYEQMNMRDSAANAYKKAININPDVHPTALLNLAEIEYRQGLYDDALKHLNDYSKYPIKLDNKTTRRRFMQLSKKIENALAIMKDKKPFNPVNLGDSINSSFAEYFPTLTADGKQLIFTRRIERKIQGEIIEEEDFYISIFNEDSNYWSTAVRMPEPVNTNGNEGTQCISPDGRYLYFTGCARKDGFGNCDIYFAKNVGGKWQTPNNIWEPINTLNWESQPSIAPDGRTLYFASTREEGNRGGSDLWMSYLDDNGIWSEPVNLGDSINTTGNENSPFIHYDGQTLYFSSDGHDGMGGKDLFYSKRKPDGTWSKPVNLGFPINTHKDEVSLIVSADGQTAFYASDRTGGKLDIYKFDLYREARPLPVSYIKGRLFDANEHKPIEGQFEIINLRTGQTVAASTSDPETGDFLVPLPTEENYAVNVSKNGYMFHSENFEFGSISEQIKPIKVDIPLKNIQIGASIVMNNIFFDVNQASLKNESLVELKKLLNFMKENPTIRIEVSGHTDNTGSESLNINLSERRAKAIFDFLIENNIDASRVTYKGYASSQPIADNATEEGRKKNRRTEITIITN